MSSSDSKPISYLLNVLLPGLGHIYWREYIFGIFIFLIMLIGVILFIVSFFFDFPLWVNLLIFSLPAIFYIFTFADLNKTIERSKGRAKRKKNVIYYFVIIGLTYQLAAPLAPVNFGLRNLPEYFKIDTNSLSPIFTEGELLKSSQLEYRVNLFFLDRPVLHSYPQRYDAVRIVDDNGLKQIGFVIGLPYEGVEMVDGDLFIDGNPKIPTQYRSILMTGNCDLTYVDQYSILIASVYLGRVDKIYQVSLDKIIGKVDKLF